jgi:hypothetical protein
MFCGFDSPAMSCQTLSGKPHENRQTNQQYGRQRQTHTRGIRSTGMAAHKAADEAIPKTTLEQLSALSLLQARAGEAAINFRRAIEAAPLSKEARAELWQNFINGLPQ